MVIHVEERLGVGARDQGSQGLGLCQDRFCKVVSSILPLLALQLRNLLLCKGKTCLRPGVAGDAREVGPQVQQVSCSGRRA